MPRLDVAENMKNLSVKDSTAEYSFNIVFMGHAKVGKTSIINNFLFGKFPAEHEPTVEEMYKADFEFSGGRLVLNILDTSGSYSFPAMRRLAISRADAFVLVYAVDDEESFEEIKRLQEEIVAQRAAHSKKVPPVLIVGNKNDLLDVVSDTENDLENSSCKNFHKVSAKNDSDSVESIFTLLLEKLERPFPNTESLKQRRSSSSDDVR